MITDASPFAAWNDGALHWQSVERTVTSAGLALVQFTDGLAHIQREDGLWALVWARWAGDPPTEVVIGPDRGLLLQAFAAGRDALPGYSFAELATGTPDERFLQAVQWIAAWRPRDVLGSLLTPPRHP